MTDAAGLIRLQVPLLCQLGGHWRQSPRRRLHQPRGRAGCGGCGPRAAEPQRGVQLLSGVMRCYKAS